MIFNLEDADRCQTVLVAMHEDPTKDKVLIFFVRHNKIHSYVELPVSVAKMFTASLHSVIELITVKGTIQ